eukprot:TRINITY_DN67760_c0_g1_i1.p1 TRINITY_DN67760_c0_g1~~TRINITY_DN67760_c0_g1_i1.p1  ORF type:complete len:159 (+),score=44.98 TRINITY_DN67760_c0_g1_i1:68-478(+)
MASEEPAAAAAPQAASGPTGGLPEILVSGKPERGSAAVLHMKGVEWHAQAGDRVVLVRVGAGGEGYVIDEVTQPTMPWCAAISGGPAEVPGDVVGRPEPWSLVFPALPSDLPAGSLQFIYLDSGGRRTACSQPFEL